MDQPSLKVAFGVAVLSAVVVMFHHASVKATAAPPPLAAAPSSIVVPAHVSTSIPSSVAQVFSVPSDPKLEADIHQAQQDLVRAIEEEKVNVADLNRRANAPGALFNEDQFLAGLPPKTTTAFRELHAQLRRLRDQELARDGKSPDFFQQPAAQAAPEAVVQHALTLERLPQSPEVKNFVASVSTHSEVRDLDIKAVARLCDSSFPCIEKAAYNWINRNLVLSSAQIQLIEHYKNGG